MRGRSYLCEVRSSFLLFGGLGWAIGFEFGLSANFEIALTMIKSSFLKLMSTQIVSLSCEVELSLGETLTLPDEIIDRIGVGRWLISIAPAPIAPPLEPVRNHDAFLNGYAPEDEGLYEDYLAG